MLIHFIINIFRIPLQYLHLLLQLMANGYWCVYEYITQKSVFFVCTQFEGSVTKFLQWCHKNLWLFKMMLQTKILQNDAYFICHIRHAAGSLEKVIIQNSNQTYNHFCTSSWMIRTIQYLKSAKPDRPNNFWRAIVILARHYVLARLEVTFNIHYHKAGALALVDI